MISPNRPFVLLPQDREIMSLTGMNEAEYRAFVRECEARFEIKPGEPVALSGFEIILINLAIGLLLTGVSYLLTPKPRNEERPELEQSTIEGQNVVKKSLFTAKSGFDSVQNVVDIGSIVPIIYAKRGNAYGGVRVNLNLVWSQLLSYGGSQFFKGLYVIGEGSDLIELDIDQTALGNNTLASYDLRPQVSAGRLTVYNSMTGGRLRKGDYLAGVVAKNDLGAKNVNGDIYSFQGQKDFCEVVLPSNQKEFGLHGFIGNNFGYKEGEDWTPLSQWQQRNDTTYERQQSNQAVAERTKQSIRWTTRAGVFRAADDPEDYRLWRTGELFDYKIFSSFQEVEFYERGATAGNEPASLLLNGDVLDSIVARQKSYDANITVGDIYKFGSVIAICVERNDAFISGWGAMGDEFDPTPAGNTVTAKFEVIEAGYMHSWTPVELENFDTDYVPDNDVPKGLKSNSVSGTLCSKSSQGFKLAIAAFSVERPCYVVEVGFRSAIALQSNRINHFQNMQPFWDGECETGNRVPDSSYQAFVDAQFCGGLCPSGDDGKTNETSYRKSIKPSFYTGNDTRYSFFRIFIRDSVAENFKPLRALFGFRGSSGQVFYSYLRFEFNKTGRREFRFVPISSWEIRSDVAQGDLYVIDPLMEETFKVDEQACSVVGNGLKVERSANQFGIDPFLADYQKGMGLVDDEKPDGNFSVPIYVDAWARLSEAFIYEEVKSTIEAGPEHSISYVNLITENDVSPQYNNLAMLGLNINSSREIASLDQLSVYVTNGVIASNLFPDVLEDLLLNDRYGVGDVYSPKQIDTDSFREAAKFSESLGHGFDGAVSARVNLRSWGAQRAQDFLLDLSISGGRFTLKPVIDFSGPVKVAQLFTAGNILENTFAMSYLPVQDRTDVIVSVKWREERQQGQSSTSSRGIFPVVRELTVKLKDTPESAPIVQIDLSNFCTNIRQAADRGYWECLRRRYTTHAVKFTTTPAEAQLQAGSIIKVGMETISYQQPTNGVVTEDGTVTSWPELGDGQYAVLTWDGNAIQERTLRITKGKSKALAGMVFCLRSTKQTSEHYKVQSVSFNDDGNIEIEAFNYCVDNSGISCIAKDFVDGKFDTSAGDSLPPFEPPVPPVPPSPEDPIPSPPDPQDPYSPVLPPVPLAPPGDDDVWSPGLPPDTPDGKGLYQIEYTFYNYQLQTERVQCTQCFDGDPAGTTYPDQYTLSGTSANLTWTTLGPDSVYNPDDFVWRQYRSQEARYQCWNMDDPGDAPGFDQYTQSELEDKTYPIGDFRRVREVEYDEGLDDNAGFYPQCSPRRVFYEWLVPKKVRIEYLDGRVFEKEYSYYTTPL